MSKERPLLCVACKGRVYAWIEWFWQLVCRLMLGTGGTIAVSVANFTLSLLLLGYVAASDFGVFAFVQTVVAFGFGVTNALFSSPLMAVLNRSYTAGRLVEESFFMASAWLCLLAAGGMGIVVLVLGQPLEIAGLFVIIGGCLWLLRLCRSYAHDMAWAGCVLRSDMMYALLVVGGGGLYMLWGKVSLLNLAIVQAVAAVLALAMIDRRVWSLQVRGIMRGGWGPFWEGFKLHGRHALIGVLTTEGSANAHAYFVTLWLGPAAYAPLAAAALFFRPVSLVVQSLTQFERGRLARLLRDERRAEAWRAINLFYLAGFGVWLACVVLAVVMVGSFSLSLFHGEHDPRTLAVAVALMAMISFFLCLQSPASALLQANADFRELAMTTVISSMIAIPLATVFVICWGAVWSLAGILAGYVVASVLAYRLARQKVPTV